jgi:hypothetical protein
MGTAMDIPKLRSCNAKASSKHKNAMCISYNKNANANEMKALKAMNVWL